MFKKGIEIASLNYPRKLRPLSNDAFYRSPDVSDYNLQSKFEKKLLDQYPPFISINEKNHVETYGLGIQVMKIERSISHQKQFQDTTPRVKPKPPVKSKREAMEEIMSQIRRRPNPKNTKLPAIAKLSTAGEPTQTLEPNSIKPAVIKKENTNNKTETENLKPNKKSRKLRQEITVPHKAEMQHNEGSESLEAVLNIKQTNLYSNLENENYMPWENDSDAATLKNNQYHMPAQSNEKIMKIPLKNEFKIKTSANSRVEYPKTYQTDFHLPINKRHIPIDSNLSNQKHEFSQNEKTFEAPGADRNDLDVISNSNSHQTNQEEYETPRDFSIDDYVNEQVRKNKS